jgi:hypothetical protein
MTTNHNLKHNGAAYNDAAELIYGPTVTAGAGRALCTCGILSEELPSGGARRAWHKAHKAAAAQQAEVLQDVEPGTPEDEVAEALAELVEPAPKAARATRQTARAELLEERKAKKARKAKETPGVDDAASERNNHLQALPFTQEITPGFWRSLGRDAAKTVVDELFPTVTVVANNNTRTLHFQGPAEDVPAAVAAVEAMWAEAVVAVKAWKLEDAAFLGRSTEPLARRQEGYHLTEEFFRSFGAAYVAQQA